MDAIRALYFERDRLLQQVVDKKELILMVLRIVLFSTYCALVPARNTYANFVFSKHWNFSNKVKVGS